MKYLLTITILIGCIFFLWNTDFGQTEPQKETSPPKWNEKHFPEDQLMMQRAWPDAAIDMKAYTNAVRSAKEALQTRNPEIFPADWTVEGPANIGARINTIAVHPENFSIIYVGFARGGVWKTTDYGDNWFPVFDEQPFLAIGDIALDPQDPNTIYVGTGDPNISGYPGIGDGVYKSTDGGQSWTHLGLGETRICSKIVVNPQNTDIIYAATMGLPFEPTGDRGLYRSENGGQSWEQILFYSDESGIIDLLMDPSNPDILYAAGWDRIRNNYYSNVTGPASKVWKTTDGGDNWTILTGGLPEEELGRVGLAMSGQDPNVLFAMYVGANSQLHGIYKTTDAGDTWNPIPIDEDFNGLSANALGGFGWYFGKIRVNPLDDNDIFLLGVDLWRTQDGGQNWSLAAPPWWDYTVHADKHDLVFFSFDVPEFSGFYLATDGGLYVADSDLNYFDAENIPTSQFYRVAHNPHMPQNYYGGMQDNGSSGGNATSINFWPRIYGGDGFQMAFNPDNPNIFFAETQRGGIQMTTDGGLSWDFAGITPGSDDRRNWDMPYLLSVHDSNILYSGTYKAWKGEVFAPGQYVAWDSISADLTKGVLTEETFHTISALDESPLVQGLLYYGSSDGLVQRTDDDGQSWVNITADLPDRYVTAVQASPTFEDNVYVSHSGYKWGEYIPRLHRSTDRGATWEDISGDLPDLAINDIFVHPMQEDSILFVATDGGVYGTIDAGNSWERVGANMPSVMVYDVDVNPVQNTLVAGTFARSIMTYPLDSIIYPIVEDTMTTSSFQLPYEKADAVKVWPNPASAEVQIGFTHPEGGGAYELVVLDVQGRLVKQLSGESPSRAELSLSVVDLAAGQYFIKVKMRHTVISGRFLITD
ncbi:MAG: T9SS type A sorting domain-containing protein [Bacteroidetes bacterium]|nr:T9SS type A sorting domain-containing protein [Bacteroidota bacterium]